MNHPPFETKIMYYDRQGKTLELLDWATLCEDENYKIVKQEWVGKYFVSTVWIGLNMSMWKGLRLIFETMIFTKNRHDFSSEDSILDYQDRYATEEQALEGHQKAVQMVKDSDG